MSVEVNIQPKMITWAIARAGFIFDEFVEKYPKVRVQDWLDDKKKPTVRQLEEFSTKVYLPFGYLFLPEPPAEKLPISFFRTGRTTTNKVSLKVQETVRLLKYRQDWLSDFLQESEEAPLGFVAKFGLNNSPEEIAKDIRATLKLDENWASQFPNWELAKTHFSQKIEDAGIVVNFNSIVENNAHRKIDVQECRGFVLVDEFAPFLFINNGDSKAAQMFTLAHELAHVWTGKSAGFDFKQMRPADDPMEKLCDKAAAEFLVPSAAFLRFWTADRSVQVTEIWKIQAASRHFKVSQIVAARRALDLGQISEGYFFKFYNDYVNKEFHKKADQKGGGGNPYLNYKARLGLPFVARLNQALKEGKILHRDVYKLTGLKGGTFQNFIQKTL